MLDVALLSGALNAQQRATVHFTRLPCLPEGHAARHVTEVGDLVARLLWAPLAYVLTWKKVVIVNILSDVFS